MKDFSEVRNEYRTKKIGRFYRYPIHLILNFGLLLGAVVFLSFRLSNVALLEWLIIPLMLLFGNFAVWFIHKYPLHERGFFLGGYSFQKHTIEHHSFFTEEENVFEDLKDLHIVLFPTIVVLGFSLLFIPIAYFLFSFLLPINIVLLILIGSSLHFILYETIHLISHLPEKHWLLKIRHLKNMWEHHRLHHDPRYMSTKNFGIVFKFADRVFKTSID